MAKIYGAPSHITAPEIKHPFDFEAYEKASEAYTAEVVAYAKQNGKGALRGEIISFGVADGAATYVVFGPTALIHLRIGDAYQFPYASMLTAKVIAQEVERAQAMAKLFPPFKAVR